MERSRCRCLFLVTGRARVRDAKRSLTWTLSLSRAIPPLPSSSLFRREYGTDGILDEPQPYFDLIKQCYPSWYCGEGINGDPVYWERYVPVSRGMATVRTWRAPLSPRHFIRALSSVISYQSRSLLHRSGQVDQPRMRVAGCGIDELLRHYVMVTEFCWVKLYPDEVRRRLTFASSGSPRGESEI
jgi:hypothetical protein